MGCASGKPASHTKPQSSKKEISNTKPNNTNNSQENPEFRNDPKPNLEKINPNPINPIVPTVTKSQTEPLKPNLDDLQKNPTHTIEHVTHPNPQPLSQVKQSQKKEVPQEPALPTETPTKNVHAFTEQKPAQLSVIPQKTDQFESFKKPQVSEVKAEEKKQEILNSGRGSIRNSIPEMQDDFLVSKITKNNESADKIQHQSSHKINSTQKSPQRKVENEDLRKEQIKITLLDSHASSRIRQSSHPQSPKPDEFEALNEQQFDLNCEFDPNTLVIDMNKVAW